MQLVAVEAKINIEKQPKRLTTVTNRLGSHPNPFTYGRLPVRDCGDPKRSARKKILSNRRKEVAEIKGAKTSPLRLEGQGSP
jgi:hypothetical protein